MKNLFYKIGNYIYRRLQSIGGFKTLGPRAIIVNSKDQVLLVKHTYTKGWLLPGGGVQKGESVKAALARELMEEVGLTIHGEPELFAIYHNTKMGGDDYPVIYVVKDFSLIDVVSPEIEQKDWFHYEALPASIGPATQQHIMEYFAKTIPSEHW